MTDAYIEEFRKAMRTAEVADLQPFKSKDHYLQVHDFSPWGADVDFDFNVFERHHHLREIYKYHWGFHLPTAELMDAMAKMLLSECGPCARLLDAGSGSGFMSKELCARGINAFAVDSVAYESKDRKRGYPMIQVHQCDALGNAVDFVSQGFDAVLLAWPGYSHPFGHQVAKAMLPGQLLIYEGEGPGGCCADDAFFEFLDSPAWQHLSVYSQALNDQHVTFQGNHDCWRVYRRLK